jgi:hypothetical protein
MTFFPGRSSATFTSGNRVRKPALQLLFALFLLILCSASLANAQEKKGELQLRTVRGTVLDKDENPVASAVVYLKNVKSQAVKTYISDDTGRYRFSGLDPNVDYEIHAEHGDLMSSTRTISSFDSRRDMDVPLKLTRKKPNR